MQQNTKIVGKVPTNILTEEIPKTKQKRVSFSVFKANSLEEMAEDRRRREIELINHVKFKERTNESVKVLPSKNNENTYNHSHLVNNTESNNSKSELLYDRFSRTNPHLHKIVRAENIFLNNQSSSFKPELSIVEQSNSNSYINSRDIIQNSTSNINSNKIFSNPTNSESDDSYQNKYEIQINNYNSTLNSNSLSIKSPKENILFSNSNLYQIEEKEEIKENESETNAIDYSENIKKLIEEVEPELHKNQFDEKYDHDNKNNEITEDENKMKVKENLDVYSIEINDNQNKMNLQENKVDDNIQINENENKIKVQETQVEENIEINENQGTIKFQENQVDDKIEINEKRDHNKQLFPEKLFVAAQQHFESRSRTLYFFQNFWVKFTEYSKYLDDLYLDQNIEEDKIYFFIMRHIYDKFSILLKSKIVTRKYENYNKLQKDKFVRYRQYKMKTKIFNELFNYSNKRKQWMKQIHRQIKLNTLWKCFDCWKLFVNYKIIKRYLQNKLKTKIFEMLKMNIRYNREIEKRANLMKYILLAKNFMIRVKRNVLLSKNKKYNNQISKEFFRILLLKKIFQVLRKSRDNKKHSKQSKIENLNKKIQKSDYVQLKIMQNQTTKIVNIGGEEGKYICKKIVKSNIKII